MHAPDRDDADDPILWIGLRADPYAGPFRYQGEVVGGDFDSYDGLGISRDLYDEVLAWNEEDASLRGWPSAAWEDHRFAWKQRLLVRLRAGVHSEIKVEAPQAVRPVEVTLSRLRPGRTEVELILDAEVESSPDEKSVLVVGSAVATRVLAWVEDGNRLGATRQATDAELFAWEDAGVELAQQVQDELGSGDAVLAR